MITMINIKVGESRYRIRMGFPKNRHIKFLPVVLFAKIGKVNKG